MGSRLHPTLYRNANGTSWGACVDESKYRGINGYLNRGIKVSRHRGFNASMHRGAQACRTRLSADTGVGQQAPSSLTPSVHSSHHCIDLSTNECGRTERRTTKSARSDAARTKTIEHFRGLQENCCENIMKFIRFRRPPSLISKGGRLPDFPNRQSKVRRVREHRDQLSMRSGENNKKHIECTANLTERAR